jgi:hypothetical protein
VNKQTLLDWAELIDKLRIYPRIFLTACFGWAVWLSIALVHWYTTLPKEDRSLEATGFGSITFVAVLGFLKLVYQTYSDAGISWDPSPPAAVRTTSKESTQTTEVTP